MASPDQSFREVQISEKSNQDGDDKARKKLAVSDGTDSGMANVEIGRSNPEKVTLTVASSRVIMSCQDHVLPKPHKCQICSESLNQAGHSKTFARPSQDDGDKASGKLTRDEPESGKITNLIVKPDSIIISPKETSDGQPSAGVSAKSHQCHNCSKFFPTAYNLIRHFRTHSGERPYQCKLCSRSFRQGHHLKDHLRTHFGVERHQCKFCSKFFAQRRSLEDHLRSHHSGVQICSESLNQPGQSKTFSRPSQDESDMFEDNLTNDKSEPGMNNSEIATSKRVSPGQPGHSRSFPGQLAGDIASGKLKTSYESEPERANPSFTPITPMPTSDPQTSTVLLTKPHQCKICPKSFAQPRYLRQHIKTHSTERPYTCQECSKSFKSPIELTVHKRTHTDEHPHQCDICPKSFAQPSYLRKHIKTHTTQRPYKCLECSKSFKTAADLKPHRRTHTGERPYKCQICSESFKMKGHLKTHTRTHPGEERLQCEFCSKSFAQLGGLNRHIKTHHINSQ